MWHPVAFHEVNIVEWRTHASPVVAGATKIAEPAGPERIILLAGALAFVQILHFVVVFKTATFQQDYFVFGIHPIHGDAGACRTSAHDADIAFDDGVVG